MIVGRNISHLRIIISLKFRVITVFRLKIIFLLCKEYNIVFCNFYYLYPKALNLLLAARKLFRKIDFIGLFIMKSFRKIFYAEGMFQSISYFN